MNRVIAQLHSLDYKKLGLESFGKPGNYFGRQIDRWIVNTKPLRPNTFLRWST
jgi:aminoglycoside phosphotransferase (APT) family kinase protein